MRKPRDWNEINNRPERVAYRKEYYRKYWRDYSRLNVVHKRELQKKYRDNLKQKAMDKYGGVCLRCGFSDIRALQFDHINGDGYKDRKEKNQSRYTYFKDILEDETNKYQLLCANCNWIKRFENGEHRGTTII